MPTPAGTGAAVLEEPPSKKSPKNKDEEIKQKEELQKEFAKQNDLVVDKDKENKGKAEKKKKKKKGKKPKKEVPREKMNPGDTVSSDSFTWRVIKLLGSGGFGDVYKVVKEDDPDKNEYAMKTEMVEGDKLKLRLKIEVLVLTVCNEVSDPEKKKHFLAMIDRGKTDKFKFMVMGLVGSSLEDIRRKILFRNYSKPTAMNSSLQTLQAISDLHEVGYLHRDIKPQNFAIGLGEFEKVIYMLDFGIARKYRLGETKQVKVARVAVKFLGTLRFASRACHLGIEQGRKDDLETWVYMLFDLFDGDSLPWKKAADRNQVITMKEKFIKQQYPKCYKVVPQEVKRIVMYIDHLEYADEPDYLYIQNSLTAIARLKKIDLKKPFDWIGKKKKEKKASEEDSDESTDRQQTGDDDEEDENIKAKKKVSRSEEKKAKSKVTGKTN